MHTLMNNWRTATQVETTTSGDRELMSEGFIGNMAKKLKNTIAGVKQIGTGKDQATNLGGEHTFDIEKRDAKKKEGKATVEAAIAETGYEPIAKLFRSLEKMNWPNFRPQPEPEEEKKADAPEQEEPQKEIEEASASKAIRQEGFKEGVAMIQKVYDQIVAEFNQSEKTEQDAQTANQRIATLRDVPLYFMDYVLADRGSYFNEAAQGAQSKNYQSVYSKKLPLGLAVASVATGIAGMNMIDDEVQAALKAMKNVKSLEGVSEELPKALAKGIDVRSGDGWTQAMQRATSINMAPDAPIGNLLDPKVQDISQAMEGAFRHPQGAETMEQVFKLAEKNPDMTFGDLFKQQSALSGRGDTIGDLLPIKPGSFFQKLTKPAVKMAIKQAKGKGGKALVKKAAGSLLGPAVASLGIAGIGGAIASATLRTKGKKSSQMSTLQGLVDSFEDVKVGEEKQEEPEATPQGETPPENTPQATEPQTAPPSGTAPQTTAPQTTTPQTTAPQTTGPQKGKDTKAKSGAAIPVFKPAPLGRSKSFALQKLLQDKPIAGKVPNWAMHFITKAVAGQMRAAGLEVQEGFVTSLDEFTLPFSSQAKIEKFLKSLPPETPPETKEKVAQAAEKSAEKAAKGNPNDAEEAAEVATDQIISQAAEQIPSADSDETPPQPVPGEEEKDATPQANPGSTLNIKWIMSQLKAANDEIKNRIKDLSFAADDAEKKTGAQEPMRQSDADALAKKDADVAARRAALKEMASATMAKNFKAAQAGDQKALEYIRSNFEEIGGPDGQGGKTAKAMKTWAKRAGVNLERPAGTAKPAPQKKAADPKAIRKAQKELEMLKSQIISDDTLETIKMRLYAFIDNGNRWIGQGSEPPQGVDGLAPNPNLNPGNKQKLPESVQRRWKQIAGIIK